MIFESIFVIRTYLYHLLSSTPQLHTVCFPHKSMHLDKLSTWTLLHFSLHQHQMPWIQQSWIPSEIWLTLHCILSYRWLDEVDSNVVVQHPLNKTLLPNQTLKQIVSAVTIPKLLNYYIIIMIMTLQVNIYKDHLKSKLRLKVYKNVKVRLW